MAIAKVGDINIYYEVHGKGEPLVLIMGYTAHSGWWQRQIPDFSQEFQVVVFDNRGAGRSDKPNPPYTMEMMTGDLAGLFEAIGIDSAHVFGVSMGGSIAQNFALNYPQKVKTLILGCTGCGGSHFVRPGEDAKILFDMERAQKLTPEESARETLPLLFSQDFINNNQTAVNNFVAMATEYVTPVHGAMGQAAAAQGHNTYDRLPEIKIPTMVIAGEADRLIPVENSRILASRIPGAELVILKKAGHGFTAEAQEEANKAVLDFLGRHRG